MCYLIGAVQSDDVCSSFPNLLRRLQSGSDKYISIVVPNLVETNQRKINLLLDSGNLVG